MFFFFFFSSRRRHTRCLSDWSSDVCSSDLVTDELLADVGLGIRVVATTIKLAPAEEALTAGDHERHDHAIRSEERRVGKECRCRWRRDDERKKKMKQSGGKEEEAREATNVR